ncbi:MAG: anaerobic sulfatase maturase [Planctomycetes bacterium]|nr:anaerobic sulfatase maturase [Planctomycetota bacterium]
MRHYPNFNLLAKPSGPLCNLDCKYCFYLEKEELFQEGVKHRFYMDESIQEEFVKQYLAGQQGPRVNFGFQGGEPTLIGLDYFRRQVELVNQYKKPDQQISYTLQTNGTRLNEEWGLFLKQHQVLVGLSIDGPAHLHDHYRLSKGGTPTHGKVMKAMRILQEHKVDYNTLTVINRLNSQHPIEVYDFLKSTGTKHFQFIPIVESQDENGDLCGPPDLKRYESRQMAPWSVSPEAFGRFYCDIYDKWVRSDVGQIYIQMFDLQLGFNMGYESSLCIFAKKCGAAGILEHNGDLYSCDHFVYPEYKLGNIQEKSMEAMFESEFQVDFGDNKFTQLPGYCQKCPHLERCYGGCPKLRLSQSPEGEPGLNYLCAGYKMFFEHIKPTIHYMAECLKRKQSPASVMDWVSSGAGQKIQRNDACPCGSGKKYKRCCGRSG